MSSRFRKTATTHSDVDVKVADIQLTFNNKKLIELLDWRGTCLANANYKKEKEAC